METTKAEPTISPPEEKLSKSGGNMPFSGLQTEKKIGENQPPNPNQSQNLSPPQTQETTPEPSTSNNDNKSPSPKRLSLRERVVKASQSNPYTKVFAYGPPGGGKTVGFCAGGTKVLHLAVGNESLSLRNHPEVMAKVDVLPIEQFKDLEDWFFEALEGEWDEHDLVVVDNISELQRRQLDEITTAEYVKAQNNPRIKRDNPYVPQQQDYMYNLNVMRRLMIRYRDLPKNLVVIAHEVDFKDETTGIVKTQPDIPPKLMKTLTGIFDVVGYMTADTKGTTTTRQIQIQPTKTLVAKTRIGNLPPVIQAPTMQMFIDANLAQREK